MSSITNRKQTLALAAMIAAFSLISLPTVTFAAEDEPKASTGLCKAVSVAMAGERTIKANVSGEVDNAEITGYKIDFGDSMVSAKQEDSHQYAQDGTYKVVGYVQIKDTDGKSAWKTADECAKLVTFSPKAEPKPVAAPAPAAPTAPTTKPAAPAAVQRDANLPKTGPSEVAATVVGMSLLGALAHRVMIRRRLARG